MIDSKNLRNRLLFAFWAIPLGWWVVNSTLRIGNEQLHILPGQIAAIALSVIGLGEYLQLIAKQYSRNVFWVTQIWLFFQLTSDMFGPAIPLTYSLFILLILILGETIIWGEKSEGRWKRASLVYSGCMVLYLTGSSLLHLYQGAFQNVYIKMTQPMLSQIGIASFLTSVFMCDTAAYFVGNFWGRHKLTTISPNKTVEGTIGGFVTALLISLITFQLFGDHLHYPFYAGILLGIASGIGAICGDILVSLMKRYFGVKDSSTIIPGHGGLLDRFGSLFFAAPCLGIVVWVMNLRLH